jgi:pimeloyl-ACP methyl ester carboxylesterase
VTDLLPGVTARRVATPRLAVNLLEDDRLDGEPVLFLHGNVSAAAFFQTTLLALPSGFRGMAPDLRGFGDSEPAPVDATRGLGDYADDLAALVDVLDLPTFHLVGWSMGGGVALTYLLGHPHRLATVTLVNPVSPYGFGGSTGVDGRLVSPDGAGTGGGTVNPEFVARLAAGDTSTEAGSSPRRVLRAHYVKPPFVPEHEDMYVGAMLSTRVGPHHYPGDSRPSENWPGVAAGSSGVLNTMSPIHLRLDGIDGVHPKPPVAWIRGDSDVIISDASTYDMAQLGALGVVPGWPGADQVPPQPMVSQTRHVLDRYAAAGGRYREVVIPAAGHSPHLEKPAAFLRALTDALGAAEEAEDSAPGAP